jgi:hypothetical protein
MKTIAPILLLALSVGTIFIVYQEIIEDRHLVAEYTAIRADTEAQLTGVKKTNDETADKIREVNRMNAETNAFIDRTRKECGL